MSSESATAAEPLPTYERTSQFLEGGRRRMREIVTPEGVPVRVEIADYGERLIAFMLDLVIWLVLALAIYVPLLAVIGKTRGSLILISIALFVFFFIRNMYFVYFELAWRGATPGKRLVGLRVIDRNGGPLVGAAVIARNLTREVEMFIPAGMLMLGQSGGWQALTAVAWLLFCLAIPATNRDRMRGGDLIAGTMVIALPKRVLLGDLVEHSLQFSFAPAQLQAYGAFELQVLEELLRRPLSQENAAVFQDVCEKICRKIGWTAPISRNDVPAFLRDFYTAQRAFLEREQLYGRTKADKYAGPAAPG